MLELRGALDLLRRAEKRLYDVNGCENYHMHSKQMRIIMYKAYHDATRILNDVTIAVKAEMGSL